MVQRSRQDSFRCFGSFCRIATIEWIASSNDDEAQVNSSTGKPISAIKNNEKKIAACIVRRVISGDKDAESELYARYFRGILRFLQTELSRLGIAESELAEDLAQDTFVTVIVQLRNPECRLEDPEKLSAYIIGIARNLARGWRRKRTRQQTEPDLTRINRARAEYGNPVKQFEHRELARLVRRVLEELPVQRDREILRRLYLNEEDKHQICEVLTIGEIHFNRVIYRARRRLRELIESAYVVK